jgi:hypothetical protein
MLHLRRYRPTVSDTTAFDAATAIHPAGDGNFTVFIHPDWTVGDKPNGGYLLSLLGRAAREVARDGDPSSELEVVSASVTYLGAPKLESATIATTVLRRGRSATHVRAVLLQGEAALVDAVFVTGQLHPSAGPRYSDVAPLAIPEPDACFDLPSVIPTTGTVVGILGQVQLRLDPAIALFPADPSKPTAPAELRGWSRFADGRQPDALSLLCFLDATPPATFPIGSSGWVPTLQMSTYVRGQPAPGWLGISMVAHLVADQMVDETCTVWDSTGQVVGQAHQLARVRFLDELG